MSFTAVTVFAYAQKIDVKKVPAPVKASFAKMYPSVTVAKWEMEDGNYEVNYKMDGQNISATYQPDGTFLESETGIEIGQLPAAVLSYVKEHYAGKKIKEAAKITNANGAINWEAEVNGIDVLFDANSKFIKEAKD